MLVKIAFKAICFSENPPLYDMNCIFGLVRIIHLNSYAGNGGAGRACSRLNKALKAEGLDSVLAVNFLFRDNPEVINLSKGFGAGMFQSLSCFNQLISYIYIGSIMPFCGLQILLNYLHSINP
jgi:hypothetical protein